MVKCLNQASGENWTMFNGDCVELIEGIPDESVGFSVFSPPFASLYVYSESERDMGNCADYDEFFRHFGFLINGLYRKLMPGRLISVHCMNLPTTKQHHGEIGIQDFRGDIIRAFCGDEAGIMAAAQQRLYQRMLEARESDDSMRKGRLLAAINNINADLAQCPPDKDKFVYHSEVCIWKDPVTAMQRTKALGLLHKQMLKDSAMSRQGIPDYVVTFRKPGVNPKPVSGELSKWVGDDSFVSTGNRSIDLWQRYASPVWMDIKPNRTLQFTTARHEDDERHICPLQLDVIERCIELWSMPDDVVLTPYLGIGSEAYCAVKAGRKAIGFELKDTYFAKAVENLRLAEAELKSVKTLF